MKYFLKGKIYNTIDIIKDIYRAHKRREDRIKAYLEWRDFLFSEKNSLNKKS